MSWTPWQLFNLALAAIFVPCCLILLVRHLRRPGSERFMEGSPVHAVISTLGLIAVALSITLPLSEAAGDRLGNAGIVLLIGNWLSEWWRARGSGETESP